MAVVLAKAYLHGYSQMTSNPVSFLPLIIVAVDDVSLGLQTEDIQRLKLDVNASVTGLKQLKEFFEQNSDKFKQFGVKTIFVTLFDAMALSHKEAQVHVGGERTLHSKPFRHLWFVAESAGVLRGAVGEGAVAEVVFAPSGLSGEQQKKMETVVGEAVQLTSYNKVATVPLVFASPKGIQVVKCCKEGDSGVQGLGEWKVCEDAACTDVVVDGVATTVCRLMEYRVFGERPLTPAETTLLEMFSMSHVQTGEALFCSRDVWFRWWGLAKSPIPRLCEEAHPCFKSITNVTGLSAHLGSPVARPCGRDRYCRNCEITLSFLETMYSLPSMVDVLLAVTTKSVQSWRSSSPSSDCFVRTVDAHRGHQCAPGCTGSV
jgi:hypothetical protein